MTSDAFSFLSEEQARALFQSVRAASGNDAAVSTSLVSKAMGMTRWVRSDIRTSATIRSNRLDVEQVVKGTTTAAMTSRVDAEGVAQVVETLERAYPYAYHPRVYYPEGRDDTKAAMPEIWSDPTFRMSAEERVDAARRMMSATADPRMSLAGDLNLGAESHFRMDSVGNARYYQTTIAECSMTARDPKRAASGWAGVSHYDVGQIDLQAIAQRAIQKCEQSANPVAIEPGRYMAILEPQAVADLFSPLIAGQMLRTRAEDGEGPFAGGTDQSKIGEKVIDERLSVVADPMYPGASFVPFDVQSGVPYRAVPWIGDGVLRDLEYDKRYAVMNLQHDQALANSSSYVLKRGAQVSAVSIEEMIASTERGLLVTRFSDVRVLDTRSMLSAGYTRDGVWLIERGKVTKAVKNFRFTESPLFALNSVVDIGEETRVFSPGYAIKVPPVRVRDFNFSSLADAV